MELTRFLLVCLGGAVGSGLRYLLSGVLLLRSGSPFPVGTLLVNITGCFALELLLAVATGTARVSHETRLLLGTGLLGGFTTYSSFNSESLALFRQGATATAILYMSATLLGGLAAGVAGALAGRGLWAALGRG